METQGSLVVLDTENGPMYLLYLAYAYVVILAGACLIVNYAIQSATVIRRQAALLVSAAVIPLILDVFYILVIPPLGDTGMNLMPASLSLSMLLYGIALFRYRVLDFMPIARRDVMAQMSDGVIVFDDSDQIIDLNQRVERV